MNKHQRLAEIEQQLGLRCVELSPSQNQFYLLSPTGVRLFSFRMNAEGEVTWCDKPEASSWSRKLKVDVLPSSQHFANISRHNARGLAAKMDAKFLGSMVVGDPGRGVIPTTLYELEHYFVSETGPEVGYHSEITNSFVRFEPPRSWSEYNLSKVSMSLIEESLENV